MDDMLADAARATAAGADVVEARLDMLYMHQVAVESEQGQSDARPRIRKTEMKLQERESIDFEIDEVLSLLEAGIELPVIPHAGHLDREATSQELRRRGATY